MDTTQDDYPVVHEIDSAYEILFVNEAWSTFAKKNGAMHLLPDNVVGSSLFDHISDPETRQLYKVIIDRVLSERRTARFPFRCDSPTLRRYMMMEISCPSQGICRMTSILLREEGRPAATLLDTSFSRSDQFLRMCSWCKMIEVAQDKWTEVEEAIQALDLFAEPQLPELTHTICPGCYAKVTHQFDL